MYIYDLIILGGEWGLQLYQLVGKDVNAHEILSSTLRHKLK